MRILKKKLHKLIWKCYYIFIEKKRAVSSAVERLPYKQDVAGSNPAPGMGWGSEQRGLRTVG